jgi:hypothetical protein
MNKYVFEITKDSLLDDNLLRKSLPDFFELEKESGVHFFKIDVDQVKTEEQACYFAQRECDRIHFLTGLQIACDYKYIETPNRQFFYSTSAAVSDVLYSLLPDNIKPQKWSNKLAMQLSLWQMANSETLLLTTRISLFFQIIDLIKPAANPVNYPEYTDSDSAPVKMTECKLLRNLVTRQGDMKNPQLINYCKYLGYRTRLPDVSDEEFLRILKSKLPLLRGEAKRMIKAVMDL